MQDKPTADAICAALERDRVRCWIAPRDIVPGANWGEAIVEGIKVSRIMVVVFSAASNGSPQVLREVERAVHKGVPIIPFRIEDILPSKSMEFFLSTPHWLDALSPPLEQHIELLSQSVRALLAAADGTTAPTGGSAPRPTSDRGRGEPVRRRRWPVPVAVAAAIVAIAVFLANGWYPAAETRKSSAPAPCSRGPLFSRRAPRSRAPRSSRSHLSLGRPVLRAAPAPAALRGRPMPTDSDPHDDPFGK